MELDPTQAPSAKGGWSQSVVTLENALVIPPKTAKPRVLETGLLDSTGAYVPFGAVWRREEPVTIEPDYAAPETRLEGNWLWGGVLYHHFGHFQVQSLARLWAIRRFREDVDGVVYVSRTKTDMLAPYEEEYLRLLIGEVPVRLVTRPTEVAQMVVPGQGFGLGSIADGTRIFRRFIHEDFAKDVQPDGPKDLFISRSKQSLTKGGFVGESVLDARMAAAGYEVFWPEDHSVTEQIAHYKAARRLIALDGSPLHLFGMVGRKDQKLAIILRRKKASSRSMRRQLARFTKAKPLVINALRAGTGPVMGKKRLISALDFEHIGRLLKTHGFLKKRYEWGALDEAENAQINVDRSA